MYERVYQKYRICVVSLLKKYIKYIVSILQFFNSYMGVTK